MRQVFCVILVPLFGSGCVLYATESLALTYAYICIAVPVVSAAWRILNPKEEAQSDA